MTRDALALVETRTAAPEPELRPAPSLSAVLVSPRLDNGAELGAMLREALPDENLLAYPKASEAIARTRPDLIYDRPAAIWLFDFRGKPVGDLADELRLVKAARPDAELIVVTEANGEAVGPCLQVTQTPERLTFLLSPLHRGEVAQAIQVVADRYRATHQGRQALEDSQRQIRRLETDLGELHTRLDIALHAARHDGLTGIMNRAGFVSELRERLDRSRQRQTVLMIDLDRFKSVNDTLGHDAGDDLVRKICTAMSAVIPAGGILARLGGDEFGVILEGATSQGVADFCGLILRICSQSRRVGGYEVQVSASIGVAHQGASASEVTLMRHADLALYAAKREGRNRYRVYDTVIDAQAKHRLTIESGLERALTSAQFRMAYQPIVKADTGEIQGFEALIRWESPELGAISPADFVPVAEETGIIQELGDWITRQAFKDCRRWGGPYVSVNLSARQFLRHNIAQQILQYAEDADLAPQRIQIELTETAIIDDVERADFNLNVLRASGVRVALDDFGTGYSSLVYLNQFAIDCIKIDKSFVDNVTRDRQSAVIVASVSKLAASLGMGVVAEGVETEAQRRVLMAAGCGSLQGFHFGRPMAAKDVIALLAGPTAG